MLRGKPQQAERVTVALETGLQSLLLEHAEAAAERADEAWRGSPAGRQVLEAGGRDLSRASRECRDRAERPSVRRVVDALRAEASRVAALHGGV